MCYVTSGDYHVKLGNKFILCSVNTSGFIIFLYLLLQELIHIYKKCSNAMKPGFHVTPFLFLASWQGFCSSIDPQINPHMCLDMTYPPAKFEVDWSKETQVINKKVNSIFSKLASILHSKWPQDQSPYVSWYDVPTRNVWCPLTKGNSSYRKKKMFDARLPDHRHPQSNNQVSPIENLDKNKDPWI